MNGRYIIVDEEARDEAIRRDQAAAVAAQNPWEQQMRESEDSTRKSREQRHIVPPLPRAVTFQASDRYIGGSRFRDDDSSEDEVPTSPMSPPARASTTQIRVPPLPRPSPSQDGDTEEATSGSDWSTEAVHKYTRTVPRKRNLPRASTFQDGGQSRGQVGDRRGSGSRLRKEVISESSDEEVDSSPRHVLRTRRSPDLPRAATFQAAGLTPLSRAAISQLAGPPPPPRASIFQTGGIGGWGVGEVDETASSKREARRVLEWQEEVARSLGDIRDVDPRY